MSDTRLRVERALVVLIALHSIGIGLGAVFFAPWGLRFGGFENVSPIFFPRQVGIFHVLAGIAYLIEYFRYRGVAILLTAKCLAVLFLTAMMLADDLPWVVPFSAAGDGAMALAVLAVRRR